MEKNTTVRVRELEKLFLGIYNNESDAIFRFCLIRTSDREVALDMTQDTFMRFWRSLVLEKDIKNHRTFLFTIARNLVIDWYRKKKTVSLEALVENAHEGWSNFQPAAREDVEIETEAEFLIRKIQELPEPYSNAVYLRCVEELKPREIAKILGESANVISVRISRGLEQLRGVLHLNDAKTANT